MSEDFEFSYRGLGEVPGLSNCKPNIGGYTVAKYDGLPGSIIKESGQVSSVDKCKYQGNDFSHKEHNQDSAKLQKHHHLNLIESNVELD